MKTTIHVILVFLVFIAGSFQLKAQQSRDAATILKAESALMKAINDTSSKHWSKGGIFSFNGQEVSLTNWAAGGQGAISVGGLVNVFFNYHKKKIIWNTNINLAYGVIKQGSGSAGKIWEKTDDRIQLTSKVGRQA